MIIRLICTTAYAEYECPIPGLNYTGIVVYSIYLLQEYKPLEF